MIMGGSKLFRDSINSIKIHQHKAVPCHQRTLRLVEVDFPNTFAKKETKQLDKPHYDALVITLDIVSCEVSRVLIDTGSSVDLIFWDNLDRTRIPKSEISGPPTQLISFRSESSISLETIK